MNFENALFCFALALQIFAWVLSGASVGFRPRKNIAVTVEKNAIKQEKKWYKKLIFRRLYLVLGASIICIFAYFEHDFVLLGGQILLAIILWFRIGLTISVK